MSTPTTPRRRYFAAITPIERQELARLGGRVSQATGVGHRWSADEARANAARGGHAKAAAAKARARKSVK